MPKMNNLTKLLRAEKKLYAKYKIPTKTFDDHLAYLYDNYQDMRKRVVKKGTASHNRGLPGNPTKGYVRANRRKPKI